ncbi:MAG: DsrE/DsrF-like family protein [Hydrogenophilales bacterium 28-61-23]|nr:MAG: DsrE/DsrF-like family protein [Hydrogenophilales bacterium 28-61-23]
MKKLLALSCLLVALSASVGAHAGDADPLFINMSSGDAHRATHAIGFGVTQQAKGHPLTIFLNDKGVLIGSKAHAKQFARQQKDLMDAMSAGGTVIICPICMMHHKVKEADLLPGIKIGSPDVTGAALFKDNTKTMTW